MNHLALYRKYRPKKLCEVVRQDAVIQALHNQIQNDSISHAYLFCGPRGTGKTSVAKIFANTINCQTPIQNEACSKCVACLALAAKSLDIVEIDAASNNGVSEIRELIEKAQYPPVATKYKVYIIDEVHMLSISAFNALLKTLEEPPKHTIFILATTEVFKLPATILSRCMRFDFKLLPQTDIERHLKEICKKEKVQFEDNAIAVIARFANGSMRDALSIAETCFSYCNGNLTYKLTYDILGSPDFIEILQILEYIFQEKANMAINLLHSFCAAGKSVGSIYKDILEGLSAIITATTMENANNILQYPIETFAKIEEIAANLEKTKLLRVLDIFVEIEQKLRYALNAKILLETAIFKSAIPVADVDVLALTQRIQKLEKQLFTLQQNKEIIQPLGQREPEKKHIHEETKESVKPSTTINSQGDVQKKITGNLLGHMMQYFRKNSQYAGLKQLCLYLQENWQNGKVILQSEDSATVKSLQSGQYAKELQEVLQLLGIEEFAVEWIEKKDKFAEEFAKMQENFNGIKIEIEE